MRNSYNNVRTTLTIIGRYKGSVYFHPIIPEIVQWIVTNFSVIAFMHDEVLRKIVLNATGEKRWK